MESRRKVLKKLGLTTAAAGLAVGGAARASQRGTTAAQSSSPDGSPVSSPAQTALAGDGPWWLLAPLTRGGHLAAGWFVAHLARVDRGAAVLTLQHQGGDVARVHLCLHAGAPRGLAHTNLLDLILMDGGQGDRPTDESLGRVLVGLAEHIRGNELKDDGDLGDLALMQAHGDRVLAYGAETLT